MKRLALSAIMGLATLSVPAQTNMGRPRLVLGIIVDQLRTDYVENLSSLFGEKGFHRMMKQGVYIRDVDFKVRNLDAVSATAMLYTGAYPFRTGVPSSLIYNADTRSISPALADTKTLGNFTNDSYSPENLRLSTLSDELAIEGAGMNTIYSVSANPQVSIIMAGHAGTGGTWINNTTGNWATTTWYKQMPAQLSTRNYSRPLSSRIDTIQWKPLLPTDKYPGLPEHKKLYPFRYTFSSSDKDVYIRFSNTPCGNREVTDVAIDCLKGLDMGRSGKSIDMLNVAYTVGPYKYVKDGDYRTELIDSYLRLDNEIGRLIDAVEKYVGAGNTIIWICGTGYYDDAVIDDKKYRIPTGEFSTKRACSLLNSYLSARHGNTAYISGFRDGQLYLDHKGIESRNLNPEEIAADAASFLARMSGISDVYKVSDILSPSTSTEESLRLAYDPKRGGDLLVIFNPGWTVTEDTENPVVTRSIRETAIVTPAFIMAPGLKPQVIEEAVDAVSIAPTIAGLLRIRSPNGSTAKPILFKNNIQH